MVGLQILALPIGVRLPGPEPRKMALAIESDHVMSEAHFT